MPNLASVIKNEIARLARKEVKAQTLSLKKAAGSYRTDIAALKRRVQDLERELRRLPSAKPASQAAADDADGGSAPRITAKGLVSMRKRLGLSAADFGRLVGASSLSIYKWEHGQARPRAKYLHALAAMRGMGKKEAAARLAALSPDA